MNEIIEAGRSVSKHGNFVNRIGRIYGRLTVIAEGPVRRGPTGKKFYTWLCRCECGNEKVVSSGSISCGAQSCGCLVVERTKAALTRHGLSRTPIHGIWMSMLSRCERKTDHAYSDYGGRGITVCERWKTFENFYADMGDPPAGLTLDRTNNDLGYSPDNCTWATRLHQGRNRRNVQRYTIGNDSLTLGEWSERSGVPADRIKARIYAGWLLEDAIFKPARKMTLRAAASSQS